ncbi:MAG: tetratricopeptide repeat protein [Dehalococcoidia bacterium]
MTLNITLTSRSVIYQCADFRLTDLRTDRPWQERHDGGLRDFLAQKLIVVQRFHWSAVIAFAGIGHTGNVDVSEWLTEKLTQIPQEASFETLIAALTSADSWLGALSSDRRRHTFSIGAFVGSQPVGALVSNWESLHARAQQVAGPRLAVSRFKPGKPRLLVAGSGARSVTEVERAALIALLRTDPPPVQMYEALAALNARVAARDHHVSVACFTAHIRRVGDGGGAEHGLDDYQHYTPPLASLLPDLIDLLPNLRRGDTGNGNPALGKMRLLGFARSPSSEAEHRDRIRARPTDPEGYSNYGSFLWNTKGDSDGAEAQYRKALQIKPDCANALGNLALVIWHDRGDMDEAERYFREALIADPRQALHRNNYAVFLRDVRGDFASAAQLYRDGLVLHPSEETLLENYAALQFRRQEYVEAAALCERYLEIWPNKVEALTTRAIALTLIDAEPAVIIELYWRALALKPDDADALANLAQFLFADGKHTEGEALVARCVAAAPRVDTELEAWFYRFVHVADRRDEALRHMKALITRGVRSPGWKLGRTVDRALRDGHPEYGVVVALAKVITEEAESEVLQAYPCWGTVANDSRRRRSR